MTWCHDAANDVVERNSPPPPPSSSSPRSKQGSKLVEHGGTTSSDYDHHRNLRGVVKSCPACGHQVKGLEQQVRRINDLPGLPAGVRFDPTDQELLQHLEAKIKPDLHHRLHPLIDEFIPTLEGENGICYTHPEKLPGVSKDGQVRHFFHRPSKAYTTGTRKRRKVHTDEEGCETRWHKTGKTRPVTAHGKSLVRGYKKILVLYTNYGKQKKPEKTSWVMHQYHLGLDEEEREGEIVVSKVFYQTQPRQCGGGPIISLKMKGMSGGSSSSSGKTMTMGLISAHQNVNDGGSGVGYPMTTTSSSLISFEQRSGGGANNNNNNNSGSRGSNNTPTTTAALFPFCCP